MKKNRLWIALAAFVIPILARGLLFYRGFPDQPTIATPDYQALTIPQPVLGESDTETDIPQTGGVVLFDLTHANQYQPADVESLQDAIEKRGGRVETVSDAASLETRLKYASTLTVISPSTPFSTDESRIVQAFVRRGGRLLVFTDATHGLVYTDFFTGSTLSYPDTDLINPLLAPFGITVNNDYLYNVEEHEGNFRNIFFEGFGKNELTFGLKKIALYGTHSIKTSSGLILFRGTESTLSSRDDAQHQSEGGAALNKDGNVLVFGDFTFLSSPYQNILDNSTLIANIADFSLGGIQTLSLVNFPYIFTQPEVQVYPLSEVQLTPETISAISGLQASLGLLNTSIKIVNEAPRDGDILILGTFTQSDDLPTFTKPFGITMDDESDTISVPGFGEVSRYGNGIILFEPNKKGNKLTLLATTPEDLLVLLSTVSSGSLDNCIVQDKIAVCSVGYGGGSSFEEDTATPEPAAPDAPPTPSG